MKVQSDFALLEELVAPWKSQMANDYTAYKNHVTRMLNFCFALCDANEQERKKLIIAGAFHDLGIWSEDTIDYLPPSVALAQDYLRANDLEAWSDEISQIIDFHHKLTAYKGKYALVEVFRQGDLVDFSLGMVTFSVDKAFIKDVKAQIPNAGFHKRLVQLTMRQLRTKPWKPAPMMKW